jgi:LuxR family maltose regulon positive regulatory protein
VLAQLERSGLFISAADDEAGWYRYHDLFRDALRQRRRLGLSKTDVEAWHRRSSAWFGQAGHVPEAMRHALAGNDPHAAADIVELHGPRLLDDDNWQVLEAWLRLLPEPLVRERPVLLLCLAWVKFLRSGVGDLSALLRRVEALLSHGQHALPPDRLAAL